MSAHEVISLRLPARPEFLRLARVTVAGLAGRLGFSWDQIEDLRLAVDELCFATVGNEALSGSLTVLCRVDEHALEVEATLDGESPDRVPVFNELSARILTALVDDHGTGDSRPARAWLRKARPRGAG